MRPHPKLHLIKADDDVIQDEPSLQVHDASPMEPQFTREAVEAENENQPFLPDRPLVDEDAGVITELELQPDIADADLELADPIFMSDQWFARYDDSISQNVSNVDIDGEMIENQSFIHGGRRYEIDVEDILDARGRRTGRRWLVKSDGVVEHTLRVLPNEDSDGVVQRAIQAIENTGLGASRELDFNFAGRRYHLEDWSSALTQAGDADTAMWCVTCDGVVEGSFASAANETESILRYRAVEIARRSGEASAIPDLPPPPNRRRSSTKLRRIEESESKTPAWVMLAWIVVGVVAARVISGVVQTVLFGG